MQTQCKQFLLIIVCLVLTTMICAQEHKIKGVTMVAPKNEFMNNPLTEIAEHKANWVCLVPFAFMTHGETGLSYGAKWQWWGETKVGIRKSIRKAKEAGLNVMLKPQIYSHGKWIGDMDFDSDAEWKEWESQYKKYMMMMVEIAIEEEVKMICIGTEINYSMKKREQFWRGLISEIRRDYHGLLTYSANWDSYKDVPVWDALDFIGISAYFPLSKSETPTQRELLRKWRPIITKLEMYSEQKNKAILFTEYGYLTVDGCAYRAWELEKEVHQLDINEQAQANAMDALFMANWNQKYWAGGFLWKWFPNMDGHEGYPEKDYTPQNKLSATVLKRWYSRD
jgi:hypothetical protein